MNINDMLKTVVGWLKHLLRLVMENVVWIILIIMMFVAQNRPWIHTYAFAIAVFSFLYLLVILLTLGKRIKEISRISLDGLRNTAAFLLSLMIAELIWTVGVIGGTLIREKSWSIPMNEMVSPGVVVGTLLGVATLFALMITFIEVKEYSRPRAMEFRKALEAVSKFMREYKDKKEASFRLCSYYPCIGAVQQDSFKVEFDKFCSDLKTFNVECICLPFNSESIKNEEELKRIQTAVEGNRPNSISQAVGAFSHMWTYSSEGARDGGYLSHAKSIESIQKTMGWMFDRNSEHIKSVRAVPDFHFLLALKNSKHVLAGFILIPLRPAGMPAPAIAAGATPPMIGVEVHDPEILSHLKDLYEDLVKEFKTNLTSTQLNI